MLKAQFLNLSNCGNKVLDRRGQKKYGFFPNKQQRSSSGKYTPKDLATALEELHTLPKQTVPKCRCVLNAKFVEPSVNFCFGQGQGQGGR